MAASLYVWPSVAVKKGGTIVSPRSIVKGEWGETFLQLLARCNESMAEEEVVKIEISQDQKFLDTHSVPQDAPLTLLNQFKCQYICYHLAPDNRSCSVSASRSAADVLMEHKAAIKVVVESRLYSCGMPLFNEESPLHDTIVVRQKLACSSPIEAQYYSSKLATLPAVCYWCGGAEETLVFDEHFTQLQREYQIVRPLCFLCKSENKDHYTSHPNNMAKRMKLST